MKRYFLAKTPTTDFVGLLPLEEIVSLLKANKITGDYVATEASGSAYSLTYTQLLKRTDIQWESVSQLLTHEVLPEPAVSVTGEPKTFSSVERRYRDAYHVAMATSAIGTVVKGVGIGLGLLVFFAYFLFGGNAFGMGQGLILGIIAGAIVTIPIYILGVLVSALAQVLKATLDTAVHSSPFLTKESMVKVMSI